MNERLFLHIHAPVFSGGTTFIQSVDADGAGWWRTRRRVWGDVDGEFTLTGPLEELLPRYLGWLGYHVVESTGTLPWAGLIWALTLSYDGEARRLAYDQVYNAIRVRFLEMLLNTGFETAGAGTVFDGWSQSLTGGTITLDTGVYASGAASAKLTRSGAASPYVYRTVTVVPGEQYRLRMAARGDGTNAGNYRVRDVTNAIDIKASTSTGITGTTFQIVTYDFIAPTGCTSVRVFFIAPAAAGSAWFDEVSLQRLVDGTPADSLTDWAVNEASITRYGRRELEIDIAEAPDTEADALRDDRLAALAWPMEGPPVIDDGAIEVDDQGRPQARLTVECVGYGATAGFRYATLNTEGSGVDTDQALTDALADCDWLTAGILAANTTQFRFDAGKETLRASELVSRLVPADWRLWVDGERQVWAEPVPVEVELTRLRGHYSRGPGGSLPVDPYAVRAGERVQSALWPDTRAVVTDGVIASGNEFIAGGWKVEAGGLQLID